MSGGAAISWGSKLQEVVALSSTEAEYMAICHAMQEGLYLRMLQQEMGVNPEEGGTLSIINHRSSLRKIRCSIKEANTLRYGSTSSERWWKMRNLVWNLLELWQWQQIVVAILTTTKHNS